MSFQYSSNAVLGTEHEGFFLELPQILWARVMRNVHKTVLKPPPTLFPVELPESITSRDGLLTLHGGR